jgi:hypothetical protein
MRYLYTRQHFLGMGLVVMWEETNHFNISNHGVNVVFACQGASNGENVWTQQLADP